MHTSTDLAELIRALRELLFIAKSGIGQHADVLAAVEEMALGDEEDGFPQLLASAEEIAAVDEEDALAAVDEEDALAAVDEEDGPPQLRQEVERERTLLADAVQIIRAATNGPLPVPVTNAAWWTVRLRRDAAVLFHFAETLRASFINGERAKTPREVAEAAGRLIRCLGILEALPLPMPPVANAEAKRGRPKKYDAAHDIETAERWERARDAGTDRKTFAKDNGLTVKTLRRVLDRVRNRRDDAE
jgi:hypothetical protein